MSLGCSGKAVPFCRQVGPRFPLLSWPQMASVLSLLLTSASVGSLACFPVFRPGLTSGFSKFVAVSWLTASPLPSPSLVLAPALRVHQSCFSPGFPSSQPKVSFSSLTGASSGRDSPGLLNYCSLFRVGFGPVLFNNGAATAGLPSGFPAGLVKWSRL